MRSLGALGIGLSVVFGAFVLVLLAELCYMFFWKNRSTSKRRVNSVGLEYEQAGSYAREAAFVGSFGGYPGSPVQSDFITKFFSVGSPSNNAENVYIPSMMSAPHVLFTIKEETKEDMEFEGGNSKAKKHSRSRSRTPSDVLAQFTSASSSAAETPFTTPPSSPMSSSPSQSPSMTPLNSNSKGSRAPSLTPFAACAVRPSGSVKTAQKSPLGPVHQLMPSSSSADSSSATFLEVVSVTSKSSPSAPCTPSPMRARTSLKALFERSPVFGPKGSPKIAPPPTSRLQICENSTTSPSEPFSLAHGSPQPTATQRFPLGTLLKQPSPCLSSLSPSAASTPSPSGGVPTEAAAPTPVPSCLLNARIGPSGNQ